MVQKYEHKISTKKLCIWIMLSLSRFFNKPSGSKRVSKSSTETVLTSDVFDFSQKIIF